MDISTLYRGSSNAVPKQRHFRTNCRSVGTIYEFTGFDTTSRVVQQQRLLSCLALFWARGLAKQWLKSGNWRKLKGSFECGDLAARGVEAADQAPWLVARAWLPTLSTPHRRPSRTKHRPDANWMVETRSTLVDMNSTMRMMC